MTIIAAADGSALGNPGPAGWAWYIDEDNWAAGGWDHGTNNMGELQAVLELFRATEHVAGEELKILCDSQYAINCISKWMPGWKKRGWKKADGKPVMNQEILKELDAAIKGRTYSFEWVRGHAGHELNEAADDRARAAATAHQQGQAVDRGPGFTPGSGAPATPASTASTPPAGPAPQGEEAPRDADPVATVYGLEQGMLDEAVRSSYGEFGDFLHPGYQEIGRTGELLDVATVRRGLENGQPLAAAGPLQLLTGHALSRDLVLIAYRMSPSDGSPSLLCSSWWQQTQQGWKLRFRQETVDDAKQNEGAR